MARGGILGVEELGPDKYQLQLANGSSPIMTGDAGRRAFEDFQRSQSAVGPNATANLGRDALAGAANAIPFVGPAVGALVRAGGDKETATDALPPPPGGQPPPERQGVTVDESGKSAEAPAAAPPERPQAPSGPTRLPYAAEGIDPATGQKVTGQAVMGADGSMQIYRPGSAGSPGGVTALGKEILGDRARANAAAAPYAQDAAAARRIGTDIAVKQNEAELGFLEQQKTDAINQAKNEQLEADEAAAYSMGIREKLDAATADYESSRAPEESKFDSIMSTIGTALGAFGAAIGHTPNFAGQYIQQLADNKMRKWEAEMNIKGKRADNLLTRFRDATGNMQVAKAAARETLMRKTSLELQQAKLSTKSDEIRNSYELLESATQAQGIKAAQASDEAQKLAFYKDKMLNKPAVAGRAASFAPATQESYEKLHGSELQDEAARLAQWKAQQAGGASTASGLKLDRSALAQVRAARNARGAVGEMASALGIGRDKTGAYVDPTMGQSAMVRVPKSTERQKLTAAMESAIDEVAKAQTGSVATEAAHDALLHQIAGLQTPGDWGAFFRHYDHMMHTVEKNAVDVAKEYGSGGASDAASAEQPGGEH